MTVAELREMLRKTQEPKGYVFSRNGQRVAEILEGLIRNKERYGYMACPCRLASGEREQDRDIVCPCAYRAEDVAQFGSCYCNLYVSPAWNAGSIEHGYVPERRPPERMGF